MKKLSETEKERVIALIQEGKTLPFKYRSALFAEDDIEYVAALKTADEPENEVEWIVSVSMLTEGWDVKNVFQIVPHERRAFNSKLFDRSGAWPRPARAGLFRPGRKPESSIFKELQETWTPFFNGVTPFYETIKFRWAKTDPYELH